MATLLKVPLPFGYHLDLDFLRVCSDKGSAADEEKLQKLKVKLGSVGHPALASWFTKHLFFAGEK